MHVDPKQFVRTVTACVLAASFAIPKSLLAQVPAHIVSSAELHKAALDASQARKGNVETVRAFLSSEQAQRELKSAHMDPEQIKNAVGSLSDAELAELASKVQKTQGDFAAGHLSDRDLIIILIAIAALILIIVAVHD